MSSTTKTIAALGTFELADELTGGARSAGPERLDAAGKAGIPATVTPGCLDMANFGERDTVPEQFESRNLYIHNPQVPLMRTTPEITMPQVKPYGCFQFNEGTTF